MPREDASEWKEFAVVLGPDGKKKISASCRHCAKTWNAPNAVRIKAHVAKCMQCPESVKRSYGIDAHIALGDEDEPDSLSQRTSRPSTSPHSAGGKEYL